MGVSTRLLMIPLAYVAGYLLFRQANVEVWAKDKAAYVIYPDTGMGRVLYYSWRPLAYLDGAVTGMRSHIGPHR
jgi:hypothetical protein